MDQIKMMEKLMFEEEIMDQMVPLVLVDVQKKTKKKEKIPFFLQKKEGKCKIKFKKFFYKNIKI